MARAASTALLLIVLNIFTLTVSTQASTTHIPAWNITNVFIFKTSARPTSSPYHTLNVTLTPTAAPPSSAPPVHCSLQWLAADGPAPAYDAPRLPCDSAGWSFAPRATADGDGDAMAVFEDFDLEFVRDLPGAKWELVGRAGFLVGSGLDGNLHGVCSGSGFCEYDLKSWVLVRPEVVKE